LASGSPGLAGAEDQGLLLGELVVGEDALLAQLAKLLQTSDIL
jgi:hypothetical protein